jgi:hypothetical protein
MPDNEPKELKFGKDDQKNKIDLSKSDPDKKAEEKAEADNEPKGSTEGLVKMKKGDQEIPVHPTAVEAHKKQGWYQV